MATLENVAVSDNGEREVCINRLTDIHGIARKTAEAMYEMGVHGYADLAQYLGQRTAQQISAALEEQGIRRPPAFIDREAWARQARALGGLGDADPVLSEEDPGATQSPDDAPVKRAMPERDAGFRVSFEIATDGGREPELRTTVCDGMNGNEERVFWGNDPAPWVGWILERAKLPGVLEYAAPPAGVTREPLTKEAETVPAESCDTQLQIGHVQLSVLESTPDVPERRLQAEISFQLSGTNAGELASKGIPYRIEGYAVDVESGASELVASEQSQLAPQVLEYVERQEFGLPDVGRYQFRSVVFLLPPDEVVAFGQGPTFRVVP